MESTGDFLSDLVHAEVDGERLSDDKIYGFLRLLLPAGGETTFRVMGNALLALLMHPDDLAKVYADRDLIPEVIEETLRWESSVTMVSRVATADSEVGGCPIASGSPVGVLDEAKVKRSGRRYRKGVTCSRRHRGLRVPGAARVARDVRRELGRRQRRDRRERSVESTRISSRTSSSTDRACAGGTRRSCGGRRRGLRSARVSTCVPGTARCRRERRRASA